MTTVFVDYTGAKSGRVDVESVNWCRYTAMRYTINMPVKGNYLLTIPQVGIETKVFAIL